MERENQLGATVIMVKEENKSMLNKVEDCADRSKRILKHIRGEK